MKAPFFSILIPVFNQVGLMDECIKSLKNQTFKDFEIIVVDDGSTDASLEMLEGFSKEFENFTILKHGTNKSLETARYTAMEKARGEYILFLDSDDYYFDYTCERIHDFIMKNPVDIVRFGYVGEKLAGFLDGNDKDFTTPPVPSDDPYLSLLKGDISPTVWKNCYSKRVIEEAVKRTTPFYCNMGEDVFWGTVLFSIAESFGTLDEILHHYLMGEGMSTNLSTQTIAKLQRNFESTKAVGKNLFEYFEKYDPKNLEFIQMKVDTMQKYVLLQGIAGKPNMEDMVRKIMLFDTEETQATFKYGCEKLIPYCVRMSLGVTDEMMDQLGLKYDSDIYS